MICEKCYTLVCACFVEVHNRQPPGKQFSLLPDDDDEEDVARAAETRKAFLAEWKNKTGYS